MLNSKIVSFTDLVAWKESHSLVLAIYKITQSFPKAELFSLTDQMKRCGVSISSNIAEGFSRLSSKEKIHFYYMARGSLTELQNQLIIARDIGYINEEQFKIIDQQTQSVHRLINGLIKHLKAR